MSVWPFVEGAWCDVGDPGQSADAARLLARLHRCLAGVTPPPRPPTNTPRTRVSGFADTSLDRWLAEFTSTHPVVQPLHGDYYAGNALVRYGRVVAVLDWDEAFLGPAEIELAWAACEWGDVLWRADMVRARRFVTEYLVAGGTASPIGDEALSQLYRERIRRDISYGEAVAASGLVLDDDDLEYRARQVEMFFVLRP